MRGKPFTHDYSDKTLKISLQRESTLFFLKFELLQNEELLLATTKIPVAKPVVTELIHTFRYGKPFLETARFTLQDENRSSLILYKGYSSLIIRAKNKLTKLIEEIDADNLDKERLAQYLEDASKSWCVSFSLIIIS